MLLKKIKIIYFIAVVITLFLSSGCAFLLNQFLTGTNQRQYTAYVYFTGIPLEIVDQTEDKLLKSISITDIMLTVSFSLVDSLSDLQENGISYITNGLNKGSGFTLTGPETDKISIQGSLSLKYATDTTIGTYSVSRSISKSEYILPSNSKNFYVLIDMTNETNKGIKLLDYSKGYKFVIRTTDEEFIRIYDYSNGKSTYLFTKDMSGNKECVFIGERGKTYTFQSLATKLFSTRTAPLDNSIYSEVVELK